MKRFRIQSLFLGAIICTTTVLLVLSTVRTVNALDYGPSEVINAVNAIRAQYDLRPYDVSQALMDIAQQQANYMAEIQRLTHDRPDGAGVPTTAENIAFGPVNIAIGSWIDDQLHFDTITGWSSGQVGVGVAQGVDGRVYISLNINSYGDTIFKSIPYTLQPGVTPQPVPTQAPAIIGESEVEITENDQQEGEVDGPEVTAYVLPAEENIENYAVVTDKPVLLIIPEQPNESFETKDSDGVSAFILPGIGAVGLLTSFVGFVYSLRIKNAQRKDYTELNEIAESVDDQNMDTSEPGDTSRLQDIPQEAREE